MDPTQPATQVVDVADHTPLPLTAAQRGMWFAENLSPDYSVIVAHYLDIRDDDRALDIDLFAQKVGEVGWDLQSPFTRIIDDGGTPLQVVDPQVGFHLEIVDLRADDHPETAARTWMDRDHQRTIDLLADRLAVTALIRVADDRAFWYLRAHHLVIDGYAALTAMQQVLDRYNAAVRDEAPRPVRHADLAELVADDHAYTTGRRRESDHAYWSERAVDLPERVSLAAHSATAPLRPVNAVAGDVLDGVARKTLENHAAHLGASPAMVLTAAFSAYLARMTGTDDVVLSLPVTGRATARIKRAGGMLSNMLPIVARDVRDLPLDELVTQVRAEMTGALRHQRYRFEDIRVDAGMGNSNTASFGPIVNMMFFDKAIELVGARVDYHILTSGILEDLRINLYQAGPGEQLVVDLHGNPELYDQATLDRHVQRFMLFLDRVLAAPDTAIADIDLLFDDELAEIHALGTGEQKPTAADSTDLLDVFTQQVRRSPDAVAVEADGCRWTYVEFDNLRRRLATRLMEDGVAPSDRVVVSLPRGLDQVVAVYAVLTAGAAYVPVDPQQPARRRALIADTVGAQIVVDADYLDWAAFDATASDALPEQAATVPVRGGDAAAYVLFTSGSTGVPKGVEVGHRAVLNRLDWMQDHHPIGSDDVVLYKTPITFDVSVWELFWPLACGARMVLARPDGHRDPDYLAQLIASTGVTTLHFVPSMLDAYVDIRAHHDAHAPAFGPSVRRVFTSGEALSRGLADKVAETSSVDLVNLYGPTEAAVDVTEHRVVAGHTTVPIGRPVPNTDLYVLDARLRRVPAGVAGELYIAGVQLARGYVGRTDLTADRFVALPFGDPGERMYRTGDLVRWNSDGELEFLGRTDFQVKIRGQRVELGEIESVITAVDGVDAVVVVARDDHASGPALVAYVRSGATELVDHDVLDFCRRHLPSHMVPSAVVVLAEFPVNASGKLDRAALPAPSAGGDAPFVAPRSRAEEVLAELLADLVGVESISVRDNIFGVGADSLTVARLVSRARIEHDLSLRLTDVFDGPTIAQMARRADDAADVARPVLTRVADRGPTVPLSHAQTRLWFVNRMDPDAATYNMPGAIRLGPDADVDALRGAVLDVLDRHESLRTRYPAVAGEPVQQILSVDEVRHVADIEVGRIDGPAADAVTTVAERGFDLVDEIGFRWALFGDDDGYVLVVVLHHITADGFSLRPLIRDLLSAYASRKDGRAPTFTELPIQYADFALWQQRMLGDDDDPSALHAADLDFWRAELAGAPDLLVLPTDRPRPEMAGGRGGYVDLALDGELTDGIRELARTTSVTPFSVVHAALAAVLARIADTDDVSIGTAVAGRDDERTADLVGMFVNTVVLRTAVPAATTVTELLTSAHTSRARAMSHADAPFERVVDVVAPQRSASYTPLFQVALTMQADPSDELTRWPDVVDRIDARVAAAKYDLSITVTDRADAYEVEISYAAELFDESSVAAIGTQLTAMLRGMVDTPDGHVATIDLLPTRRIAELTRPVTGPAAGRTLRELLSDGAAQAQSAAPAVVGTDSTMTWAVFEARTNQLARELISHGAGPGTTVAVMIARSIDSVVAVAAVAKTGAAFVAIDPRQPAARRSDMIADSTPLIGLTTTDAADDLPEGPRWLVIDDATVELQLAGHCGTRIGDNELTRRPRLDDLAYLVYTSGSTGRPKAAAVTHRGLAGMLANQQQILGASIDARVLHVASPSFDASIFEITMALGAGGRLVVSPADVYGGTELAELIAHTGATHAVMTPSALSTLEPAAVPGLSTVTSVGEACPPELVRRWAGAGRAFFNLYGPTEATIWATAAGPLRADDTVTVGSPVPGVGALVLDRMLRPVPTGVPGELYLTGLQLARGYHGRADLSATRFTANPFEPGGRMYRTGDRVTRTAQGELIYHGRNDFQLKIRGQRIEPGEVDGVLMDHPAVTNALSLGVPGPVGDSVLVAYVTVSDPVQASPEAIVAHAAARLPAYMVPHTVVIVDAFAVTAVGKIDRSALPPVDFSVTKEFIAPRSEMETVVADVFAEVLAVSRVSVHDSLFELGGNSLTATKVAARLGELLDRRIPVKELFEMPTVAAIAGRVAGLGRVTPPLTPRTRAAMVPVSGLQRGMWLVNRADPDSANYNVALALRLTGRLDHAALADAMADLIGRHEALRTTYPMVGSAPRQVIVPADVACRSAELEIVDVDGDLADAIETVTGEGFDIVSGSPVRTRLLRVSPDDHVLVFVVHHISADGASMAPLARDLMAAYSARCAGSAPAWRPLPVQYADFTLWLQDRLATEDAEGVTEAEHQLDYWAQRLRGAPEQIVLPTDRPRPRTPGFVGSTVDFEIGADLAHALETLARVHNTTLFMVTHAALAVLLARISDTDDVVVGTPYAGRDDAALDDVVGMFVNTLALRTRLSVAEDFAAVLDRVRQDDLADIAHSDVPFDEIVSRVLPAVPTSFNPLFQVMFAFQNIEFPTLELDGLRVSPEDEQLTAAKVDLQLTLFPDDPAGAGARGAVRGQFLFDTDLFDEATVARIARWYLAVLAAVVDDPMCIVGDIVLDPTTGPDITEPEAAEESSSVALPDLVTHAAQADPVSVAFARDGFELGFADLDAMTTTMSMAMPDADRDAALTMALMTMIPEQDAAAPDVLDRVVAQVRHRAHEVLTSVLSSAEGVGRA
ncbi:amino acid adenylation domain-containing protein [Gordonia sp. CPCC 206044]|uniref:amino acid adenylation domain-containing protein n=1 Tax=Gordonia sp. CPCC 206044 TaxID=3140793 RepID=UPI003AF33950